MDKKIKRLSLLPPEVRSAFLSIKDVDLRNSYIKVLRTEGWTLESISKATGMTRERIRQIATDSQLTVDIEELPVPQLPVQFTKPKREFVEPSPETLARLLELQPKAQQVRSNASRFREEAEEYTRLLNYATTVEGATLYRLAKRLGVTHSALRFRLVRYGYLTINKVSDSKVYAPINPKNRFPVVSKIEAIIK